MFFWVTAKLKAAPIKDWSLHLELPNQLYVPLAAANKKRGKCWVPISSKCAIVLRGEGFLPQRKEIAIIVGCHVSWPLICTAIHIPVPSSLMFSRYYYIYTTHNIVDRERYNKVSLQSCLMEKNIEKNQPFKGLFLTNSQRYCWWKKSQTTTVWMKKNCK